MSLQRRGGVGTQATIVTKTKAPTVGNRADNPSNVVDHWREHLSIWYRQNIVRVRYESLVQQPERYLQMLADVFRLDKPDEWTIPDRLVGWYPSGGQRMGWMDDWSFDDQRWLFSRVPVKFYGLMENAATE